MANKDLGKRIKEIRLKLVKSQEEFGNLFDPPAPKSAVSRWEHGGSPNKKRLKKIAKLGQTTVDYLLNGSSDDKRFVSIMKEVNKKTANSGKLSDKKSAELESFDELITYFKNFFRRNDLPQTLKNANYNKEFLSSANTALMILMMLVENGIEYASYVDKYPDLRSKWLENEWTTNFLTLPSQFGELSSKLYVQEQELVKELKKIKSAKN